MALTTVDRGPGRFRNASPGPQLFVLCAVAVTLMVLDHRNEYLTGVRKTLSVLLYPVELLVSAPASLRRSVNETLVTRSELLAENQRLKAEALARSARLQKLTALQAENARLRALLDSTARVAEDLLIAEIVTVDMNPFRNTIVINKGSNDGIFVGQPLIDADGVVGQITRDRVFTAEAMLVTDVDHAVPVEIVRNRLRTIAVGTGELNRLSLPFLPRNADVGEGDLLVTSGLGGKFPAGYPVGVVRDVRSVAGQPFLEIDAQPSAALNRIREVLLIKPGDPPPAPGGVSTDSAPAAAGTAPAGQP